MDMILSRRSIRKYTDKKVSHDLIKQLLEAGMSAPSAVNSQPWHFIIVEDKNLLEEITKIHPYAQMAKEASLAILVCADTALEKFKGFWAQDCSAATENILIAANSLGLGAVWVGLHPLDERKKPIRSLFNIPENIEPFCLIPIGYPGEKKERANRYNEERIHKNLWS